MWIVDGVLWIVYCGWWIVDSVLWIVDGLSVREFVVEQGEAVEGVLLELSDGFLEG